MLVPLFSLLIHLTLFFFVGVQAMHTPLEINDEEIIAMVDLSELPPQLKPPEPPPPIESPMVSAETNPIPEVKETPENKPPEPAPILDPELDEVLENEPEADLNAPIETAQNIVLPQEPAQTDTSMPDKPAEPPEPVSIVEDKPIAPETSSETAPENAAPEPVTPIAPDLPSAQEVAKASEIQDPPKPRFSKEKVKKSGLLGLLGNKKRKMRTKNILFSQGLKRPRKNRLQGSAPNADSLPTEGLQKMAHLKNKLLKSEQKRLMTKRSLGRQRKSQLKIVQGSGRNFGVISSAIAQEEWRLTSVYNRLLQKSPGLQGNLIIEFTISPEGRVIKSHVLTSSFANIHFEKALIQAIRLWKFPMAKEGETTILYPLAFSPAG